MVEHNRLGNLFAYAVLALGILASTGFYLLRYGPGQVAARSRRLLKWLAPFWAVIVCLRVLAWLFGGM